MQNDQNTSPEAALEEKSVEQGSPIRGTFVGLFVTLAGFALILNVPYIFIGFFAASNWKTEHGIDSQAIATLMFSAKFAVFRILFAVLAGFIPSLFGGYIFARITRSSNYHLAYLLACVSSIAIYFIHGNKDYTLSYEYKEYDSHALTMHILVTTLTAAGTLLGTKYGMRKFHVKSPVMSTVNSEELKNK